MGDRDTRRQYTYDWTNNDEDIVANAQPFDVLQFRRYAALMCPYSVSIQFSCVYKKHFKHVLELQHYGLYLPGRYAKELDNSLSTKQAYVLHIYTDEKGIKGKKHGTISHRIDLLDRVITDGARTIGRQPSQQ